MIIDSSGYTISVEGSSTPYVFFNCCSSDIQQWAIKHLCAEPFYPMTEKVYLIGDAFVKIPKIYIVCTKDQALTIEAQKIMHENYKCRSLSLPTDHSPFLSMPNELADHLLESIF